MSYRMRSEGRTASESQLAEALAAPWHTGLLKEAMETGWSQTLSLPARGRAQGARLADLETIKRGAREFVRQLPERFDRGVTIAVASALILLTLPLFVVIALAIMICDGDNVFYAGARLGLRKKRFTMYKFRTLRRDAQKVLGPQLLSDGHKLTTPIGKYLRNTRLDELPQLFNVLRGDMNFIGPRPERPEVYEHICRGIPNYDRRFSVKPGLIGHSQLYTPHGSPKAIRARIDNQLACHRRSLLWEFSVIALTGAVVVRNSIAQTVRAAARRVALRGRHDQREMERVGHKRGVVLVGQSDGAATAGRLVDINEQAFLLRCDQPLAQPLPATLRLRVDLGRRNGHARHKTAVCHAQLYRETKREDGQYDYVLMYTPVSPLNSYLVLQYFLKKSVA